MHFVHRTRRLSHPALLHIFTVFACVIMLVGLLAVGWPQAAAPVMAQSVNQSYDCGTYGAGNYGSNDCVVAAVTPTPTPNATKGGLPVTGAQLIWIALIGLGLISLGIALSLHRKRSARGGHS